MFEKKPDEMCAPYTNTVLILNSADRIAVILRRYEPVGMVIPRSSKDFKAVHFLYLAHAFVCYGHIILYYKYFIFYISYA